MKQEKPKSSNKSPINSISFGPLSYDQRQHVLRTQALQGDKKSTCSITEKALKTCFHAGPTEADLTQAFNANRQQIATVAQKKLGGKWNLSQELLLNEQDFQPSKGTRTY